MMRHQRTLRDTACETIQIYSMVIESNGLYCNHPFHRDKWHMNRSFYGGLVPPLSRDVYCKMICIYRKIQSGNLV